LTFIPSGRRITMALSIKKRGLLVTLMVCAAVVVLCSGTWAKNIKVERFNSFMQDTYSLGFLLPTSARQAAIDYVYELDPSWVTLPYVWLSLSDRSNYRDNEGEVVGTGSEVQAHLLLTVRAPPDSTRLTLLSVKSFRTNQDIIEYHMTWLDEDHEVETQPSHINYEHVLKREEGITRVRSKYEVNEPDDTIRFMAKWEKASPSHFPLPGDPLGSEDLVAKKTNLFLRYAIAPEKLFGFARNDTISLVPLKNILELDIYLSDEFLGLIFNDLTVDNLFRVDFVQRLQTIDEIE
jgi:hypothetical protein